MTPGVAPPLPAYSAGQLGPERTRLAVELRQRLWAAGLRWPVWIDARPGRLGAILGDCIDPPLGQTRAALLRQHRGLLTEGLGALGLALFAPRLALATQDQELVRILRADLRETSIEICHAPAIYPAQPARALHGVVLVPWVVPAETLCAAGAALRSGPVAPRLCSVVGALRSPQVLLRAGPDETPRQLVRRAGGASTPAWVALRADPLQGELWPADQPLPVETQTLYILPARHTLVRRHHAAAQERARAACLGCRICTDFCPEAGHGTAPHRIMWAVARGNLEAAELGSARGCIACGACSISCPAGLLPGAIVAPLSAAQPPRNEPDEPAPPSSPSRLPLQLALRRLGLTRYAQK